MLNYKNEDLIELLDGAHIRYEDLLSKIATYLFVTTNYETQSNNMTIDFDEIEGSFGLPEGFIEKQEAEDIEGELFRLYKEQVAGCEIIYETDCAKYGEVVRQFDITLYDAFIMGITEDDCCIVENGH